MRSRRVSLEKGHLAMRKLVAEFTGTFILVFGGCGSAVFSAAFPSVGIGLLGVSLAFGLTVLGCAYAVGHVSGCHLNPAVTLGLCTARRFAWKEAPGYIVAQLAGAGVAAGMLVVLLRGLPQGYDPSVGGLAANGFGEHSPGHYSMAAALVAEVLLTFIFLTVILGSTAKKAVSGLAGIPIGRRMTAASRARMISVSSSLWTNASAPASSAMNTSSSSSTAVKMSICVFGSNNFRRAVHSMPDMRGR